MRLIESFFTTLNAMSEPRPTVAGKTPRNHAGSKEETKKKRKKARKEEVKVDSSSSSSSDSEEEMLMSDGEDEARQMRDLLKLRQSVSIEITSYKAFVKRVDKLKSAMTELKEEAKDSFGKDFISRVKVFYPKEKLDFSYLKSLKKSPTTPVNDDVPSESSTPHRVRNPAMFKKYDTPDPVKVDGLCHHFKSKNRTQCTLPISNNHVVSVNDEEGEHFYCPRHMSTALNPCDPDSKSSTAHSAKVYRKDNGIVISSA